MGPQSFSASPNVLAWAQEAKVVKAIDNPEILKHAPQADFLLYRHFFPNQNLSDPPGALNAVLADLKGWRDSRLVLLAYVGIGSSATAQHIAFLKEFARLAHAAGYKVGGPGFYSGSYANDWNVWRGSGWHDWLDVCTVQAYWSRQVGFTQYNAWAWRSLYNSDFDPPFLVVDECGEDTVRDGNPNVNNGYVGFPGWQANNTTPEQIIDECVSYAQQLPDRCYATPFVCDATPAWSKFDLTSVALTLRDRLRQGVPPVVPTPSEHPTAYLLGGDVSDFQVVDGVNIDWKTTARCWSFAMMKATQGIGFTAKSFAYNWFQAGDAQIGARLAYHYGVPAHNSGASEAQYLLYCLDRNGFNSGDNVMLDLEQDKDNPLERGADLAAYALDWAQTVKAALGVRKPVLYSNQSYLIEHKLNVPAVAETFALHLAEWDMTLPTIIAPWSTILFWQWTVDASAPGVPGQVDLDYFNGSLDEMRALGKP
jgi:GH25 family lysozyme M1 (1,4-beta-N-acetylmuramidase)